MSARAISRLAVFFMSILLLGTMFTWSQATQSGSVSGQVTDQSGGVIPGAEVVLIDASTQAQLRTTSNAAGRFIIVSVPSGTYTMKVSHEGFTTQSLSNVAVTIGASVTVNAQLKVGSTKETVTVEAQTLTELATTNATVGNTIDSKTMASLPNMGRDVQALAVLQPGVTPSGYTAGAERDQNSYRLDGGNVSDDMGGDTITYNQNMVGQGGTQENGAVSGVVPTPIESIEEVKVSVAGQGIDFNSSAGSDVQMVTKRGTNSFHGSVYEYYFDSVFGGANSWQNNHTPSALFGTPYTPIVSNHRNRYGFSLGGKTYFFMNFEYLRFPNYGSFERAVPTAQLRAGVVQVANSAGVYQPYNLNPTPVTVGGVTYQPALCGAVSCDPRNIGMSSATNLIWNKYMPLPNDFSGASGDLFNTAGFLSSIKQRQTTNNYVGRVDHDFGDKNRFFVSYRYYKFQYLTSNQYDIGGGLPGDTLGQPVATAPRPQKPGYFIAGLTSNLTPSLTNDLRVGYTRNYWQWFDASPLANPLIPGEGGGPEISGETATPLLPYNINTQSTRTRFWDGHDYQLRDDLSLIKGNHLFQFGGSYQRNWDYHSRNDNGSTIDVNPTYLITSTGITMTNAAGQSVIPAAIPASNQGTYSLYYAEVLGMVAQSQVLYSRAGSALNLQPIGSQAFDQSIIPYYNVYWGDTWHVKPTLTVVYGMAYSIEMPPYEVNGKQIALVDASGNLVTASNYLAAKQSAALQGQNYNPQIGYALVGNVGSGLKYPYNPYYGEFSPRAAFAWNPSFSDGLMGKLFGQGKTVIRGGYTRLYGRVNGVDQVLVPLLGPGFLQGSACTAVLSNGTCGSGSPNASNVFRFGSNADGIVAPIIAPSATLPQPYFPGSNGYPNAGDPNTIDPNFKPNRVDSFQFSIQRAITRKLTVDVGYIGRIDKHDFQEINIDAIPTMMTLGGQTFAQAYAGLYTQTCTLSSPICAANFGGTLTAQPFFENLLGGANSSFCKGFANCTTAIVGASANQTFMKNNNVAGLWQALNNASSNIFGVKQTTIDEQNWANSANLTTALGYSNYNALYVSTRMADWKGITLQGNLTWSRALGTAQSYQATSSNTALNPWNLGANYGPQAYDIPIIFNLIGYYQPSLFKGRHDALGYLMSGWTFSQLFQAQSGNPSSVGSSTGNGNFSNTFGETAGPTSSISSTADGNAVSLQPYTGGNSRQSNVTLTSTCTTCLSGTTASNTTIGSNNPAGTGMWTNPGQIYSQFRPCVLGVDTNCGGYVGSIRTEPIWNVDATLSKDFAILKENRLGATFILQVTNVLNHMKPSGPSAGLTGPTTFGRITTQANTPRNMEFALRLHF